MDLSALGDLKKQLVTATELSDVLGSFLDHFGGSEEFMRLGQRAHDPLLEAMLAGVAEAAFERRVRIRHLCLVEIPEHAFIHGALTIDHRAAQVIYFRDLRSGLLCIACSDGPEQVQFCRFVGSLVPAGWSPENN